MQTAIGVLFRWQMAILIITIILAIVIYRPFCKYLCPLSATYAFFNRVSLVQLRLDSTHCINCGKCTAICKMGVNPLKTPHSGECIRCGDCVNMCPTGALSLGIRPKKQSSTQNHQK